MTTVSGNGLVQLLEFYVAHFRVSSFMYSYKRWLANSDAKSKRCESSYNSIVFAVSIASKVPH